jgi:hypothetical protein
MKLKQVKPLEYNVIQMVSGIGAPRNALELIVKMNLNS